MSQHSADTLSWFRANQYLLFLLNAVWLKDEHPSNEADILGESIKLDPMNVTSNGTTTDTDNGLSGGSLFLVVLSATSAWCLFIMCVVCCSEYRGYQRRGTKRSYEGRRNGPVEAKSYAEKKEHISMGMTSHIQQDLSTVSPSEEFTNSSIERKDEQNDVFDFQNEIQETNRSIDFPTPRTRKTILPPLNVGNIISVEAKCHGHGDTSSLSKETLLEVDKSIRKTKKSQMTPVIVHS